MNRSAVDGGKSAVALQGEQIIPMNTSPIRAFISSFYRRIQVFILAITLSAAALCIAQTKPTAPVTNPEPDVLVLSNGDTLHGKFVSEVGVKVTFHSDALGDISLSWDKIKELHATEQFGVLNQTIALRGKKRHVQIPVGAVD